MFRRPLPRCNRVWQTDFSEFDTTTGGRWMLTAAVDYWAKMCLTCSANGTQAERDVVAIIEAAIEEAERLMGHPLKEDYRRLYNEIRPHEEVVGRHAEGQAG